MGRLKHVQRGDLAKSSICFTVKGLARVLGIEERVLVK
jgi:hypothetical protein